MAQSEKRQRFFLNKAQHQIKEIEHNCREVMDLTSQLNISANQIHDSDVSLRKIQFLKCQIKDKLRQYASFIDQVYKVIDRKITILMQQIKREGNHSGNSSGQVVEKDSQKTNQKSNHSDYHDKYFTETLNPRVLTLQAKINQYQQNQINLNYKITELKHKNQTLLEEFTRLSNASNKKINQLSGQLQNITSRDKDSFNSYESAEQGIRTPPETNQKPFLLLDQKAHSPSQSPRKPKYDQQDGSRDRGDRRPFTFGCLPKQPPRQQGSGLISFSKNSESHTQLDKQDKHRRFDFLLNKLRYGEKETRTSVDGKKKNEAQQSGSVFSKDVIKRYQV